MAYGDVMIIRDDPKTLLNRLAAYVAPFPAKVLAARGGCSVPTAEKWREGVAWPNPRHWMHLVATFGTDITEAVFHPDRAAARLAEECRALEDQLAAKRAALGVVAEGGGRSAVRRPALQLTSESRSIRPDA